jgi:hypothetical protein
MTYGGHGGTLGPGLVFGYLAGRHAAGRAAARAGRPAPGGPCRAAVSGAFDGAAARCPSRLHLLGWRTGSGLNRSNVPLVRL